MIDVVNPDTHPAPPDWAQPLGSLLGSGGFASVWEIVSGGVLKVAHADHELSRARLRREAEALERIGAPSVPEILGHGVLPDGRPWIAMERVKGPTLADLVSAGRIPLEDVIRIGGQVLDALAGVHAAGFVHRDIKPDNIVRSDGRVVLLDLGLARKYPDDPDDPTRANVQVGSLEYIAPEQLVDASAVDPRSDLYAFGCVLFELIAGRPPFVGDAATLERAHAAMRPPPLGTLVTVPAAVEALVTDLLAKAPERRPASAEAGKQRLHALRHDRAPAVEARSMSVIAEGKQPVVLVWIELPRVDRAILGSLAARKVLVLSQRGRRVLGALIGGDHADPAVAAIAAARDLVAIGARVALHLDLLRVAPSASGLAPVGDAIDTPESWLPQGAWTGALFTRAFAAVVQTPTRASEVEGLGEFRAPVEADAVVLFGREALLSDLVAHAGATIAGPQPQNPGFAVITGDPGVGKTVVAAELAARLRGLGVRVELVAIPPPGTTHAAYTALASLVHTPPPGVAVVRAIGDALRAAARARPTAIVIDDLQFADHDLLDALEYATLGGEPLPLWIAGVASTRLDERRPSLGQRADRHRRDALGPLDDEAAMGLTAKLLEPAQYAPLRALRKLVELARGNPLHLTMLAHEVHERGAVRTRAGGEHFLDTTALDALPPIALGPWLAARELAGASVELVALARLCAVLGGEFDRAELAAVVELVERAGGASTPIDVDVGLRELAAAGLVVAAIGGWRFRQTLLEEGLYTTTAEPDRVAIHRAALAYWQTQPATESAVIAQLARHAEASRALDLAADAYAMLGDRAHVEHRIFDADQAWDRAVANLPIADWRRARALLGRARARERLMRLADALADLAEAVGIAVAIGDLALEIETRLEESTVHDLREDFAASREAAAAARVRSWALAERDDLVVDLELAEARGHFRDQAMDEAIAGLDAVRARARAIGKLETEIVAGVMLGPSLVAHGELARATTLFEELIAACEASGDRFHLAAAYGNRTWLWSALGKPERTAEDLRFLIQLARENGQPMLERNATHNLAEDRLWQGAIDEAIRLAQRSLVLKRDHSEGPTYADELLLARAFAAAAQRDELATLLPRLVGQDVSEDDHVVLRVLQLVAEAAVPEVWAPVVGGLSQLPAETRLELAHLAFQHHALSGPQQIEIQKLAESNLFWAGRFGQDGR